jgi:hypothetical protein
LPGTRHTVTVDPAGEIRALGDVCDPELGHPLGWTPIEVVPATAFDRLVEVARWYASRANPPEKEPGSFARGMLEMPFIKDAMRQWKENE